MFLQSDSFNNKKSLVYLIIVFIVFGLAVFLIWRFNKTFQVSQVPQAQSPIKNKEEKKEILTPEVLTEEKITSSLAEPLEPDKSPPKQSLTEVEIKKALQQKIPANEKSSPLSQSAIQDALNQK